MDSDTRGAVATRASPRVRDSVKAGRRSVRTPSGQWFRRPSGIVRLDELVEFCVRGSLGGDQAIVGSR